ncbi:amidohydrolase family protein [Pseudonocardia spinosispora]|uniref:amidohydrolase family protein n=1 Tax=Pseudonocardia spinosispora TaxID=103441 RepID=UPI00048ADA02|nr:amidohydrolase family protein [Pseudonocardia spinosispora]
MVLRNARLADGTTDFGPELQNLVVTDGLITSIGPADGATSPDDIDVAGATVVPGLIDAHMHVLSSEITRNPGFGPPPQLKGDEPRARELGYFVLAAMARAVLAAGITTVRDVGCDDYEAIALRQAVNLGVVPGPQILSCGRIISATSPGGMLFTAMYRQADGSDEMRKAVREQLRAGADFIKFMATGARSVQLEDPEPAQMTRAEMRAIIEEAHRMGFRVAAHAEGLDGARIAIEEGVDTIEHGLSLHRKPALLDTMAQRGTVLVPTLTTFHDLAERFTDKFTPALVDQAKRQLDEAYATVRAARDAGVTIALGHDSGPPGDAAIELVRMVEGGLSTAEALAAGTRGSAAALGLADRGTLAVGQRADLLIVDGDPLADIRVLNTPTAIRQVIKNGGMWCAD